jgi:hypothetical protein
MMTLQVCYICFLIITIIQYLHIVVLSKHQFNTLQVDDSVKNDDMTDVESIISFVT